jgi:WhiB family transcriptional regulator, redox-sensing transcriptional regulator
MADEWKLQAKCRDMDPGIFYPTLTNALLWTNNEAEQACANCKVREECLDYALQFEDYGFWAGTTELERRKLRKARGIVLEAREPILRLVQPHGTPAAYTRHKRRGEEACEFCKQAHNRSKQILKETQFRRSHHAP